MRVPLLASLLVLSAFAADGVVLVAMHGFAASGSVVASLLWLAWMLSLAAFFALRGSGGEGGGGPGAEDPEPPWWPSFERQLRDHTRGGPRTRSPRAPTYSR